MMYSSALLFSTKPPRADLHASEVKKEMEELDRFNADPCVDRTPIPSLSLVLNCPVPFPSRCPVPLEGEVERWPLCSCYLCTCGYPNLDRPANFRCCAGLCDLGDESYCCEEADDSLSANFPRICGRREVHKLEWLDLVCDISDAAILDDDFPLRLVDQIEEGTSARLPSDELMEEASSALQRFLVASGGRVWHALVDFTRSLRRRLLSDIELDIEAERRLFPSRYYTNREVEHAIALYFLRYAHEVLAAHIVRVTTRHEEAKRREVEARLRESNAEETKQRRRLLFQAASVLASAVEDEVADELMCDEDELFASARGSPSPCGPPSRSRRRTGYFRSLDRRVRRRLNMDEAALSDDEERCSEPTPPYSRS